MTHLLVTLLGAFLFFVTFPLVAELLLVTSANGLPARKLRKKSALEVPDRDMPSKLDNDFHLSFIVPAHNEELLVANCVRSLLASAAAVKGQVRVLVVAHNCVDKTAQHAAAAGAEVLIYNDPAAVGKGFALRHGFRAAIHGLKKEGVQGGANHVMVVDSDSIVTPNTVSVVEEAFAAGAHVVQCRYEMMSTTSRSSTRLAALAFRGFNVVRPRGRDRLGLSAGILGNGFGMAAEVLEAIPYDAFSVVEDLEYHLHLVMAGERVRYLDRAVISADFPESRAGESVQRSRWEGGRLLTARMWALPLTGQILRGRLRLIEPLCDLSGLPLAFGAFALLFALAIPLHWLRWYAAGSLAVVLAHVLTAAWAGPDFLKTLQLLALAPLYMLRKLWMIPGVIRGSSAKAEWVRTERNNTL